MRPQMQLHQGGTGVAGDCYRTCLAMVLDMDRDEVPHFCEHVPPGTQPDDPAHIASDEWERGWLAERGLTKVVVPHGGDIDVWQLAKQYHTLSPGAAVILQTALYGRVGVSDHVVVLHNGRLYDPLDLSWVEPLGCGMVRYQPSTHGLYWVTILAQATNPLTHAANPANVVSTGEDN